MISISFQFLANDKVSSPRELLLLASSIADKIKSWWVSISSMLVDHFWAPECTTRIRLRLVILTLRTTRYERCIGNIPLLRPEDIDFVPWKVITIIILTGAFPTETNWSSDKHIRTWGSVTQKFWMDDDKYDRPWPFSKRLTRSRFQQTKIQDWMNLITWSLNSCGFSAWTRFRNCEWHKTLRWKSIHTPVTGV